MSLLDLPTEILLMITAALETEYDILQLLGTCQTLHDLLLPSLYKRNIASGSSALLWCSVNGVETGVRGLLSLGANANVSTGDNDENRTPLMLAAERGRDRIVELLLEHKADVNMQQADGITFNPVNLQQQGSATALHVAATHGHEKAVQTLLQYGADINSVDAYGQTPFICAVFMGQCQIMSLLLDHGANMAPPNLPEGHSGHHYWYSPIHAALRADKKHRQAVLELLLLHGADMDLPDNIGESALHRAIAFSDVVSVKFLIDHGADVNRRGFRHRTPLHAAMETVPHQDRKRGVTGVKEDEEILRYLLDRGSDWTLADDEGLTPLNWAEEGRCSQRLLKMLREHIASVEGT
ncbi:hypothetical protein N7474_009930 [Penicillium riverlandense]|uniref:uncharacterized protein n=1 Tax=Penicillium riverlandense TaxID=1903569 RepID=UPI0025499AD8|nr:uncharacterized protein N7474_009930 [Penicillium riverlandense]KAJ5808661.1 hypothetical protein N7474_009930 [Penicillium riverlandense]